MERKEISKAALGRVPAYIRYLKELPQDIQFISSASIAKDLGLGEVQVRKDLSALGGIGKPKVGYERWDLINRLESVLNGDLGNSIVIGAGMLGTALLSYEGFAEYGCNIMAAFDNKITSETTIENGKKIYPIGELQNYLSNNDVQIGIIAVPSSAAQEVLNQLCTAGIKYIWCFAPCRLYKPANVTIQYENMALSLAHLKSQIIKED